MGDRGNIVLKQDRDSDAKIYLYTHWCGTELPQTLAAALDRGRGRWNDPAYLARIIFCTMVPAEYWADETGYGISTRLCDNEHDLIEVDMAKQTVKIGEKNKEQTYEEFVETHKEQQ